MQRVMCPLMMLSSFVFLAGAASADDALPKTAETFEIEGQKAFLYAAPKLAKGKPWVWYAPTLKGVSLAQRKAYFESFLRAGVNIAGFDLGEVRGSPDSTARFTRFDKELVQRDWSTKPILLGQSRGGLMMLERHEAGGGPITVKLIPGEGHKVSPAFFECQELIDFVLKQVKPALEQ